MYHNLIVQFTTDDMQVVSSLVLLQWCTLKHFGQQQATYAMMGLKDCNGAEKFLLPNDAQPS